MESGKIHLINEKGETLCNHRNGGRVEVPKERLTKDIEKVTCGNCKQTLNRK